MAYNLLIELPRQVDWRYLSASVAGGGFEGFPLPSREGGEADGVALSVPSKCALPEVWVALEALLRELLSQGATVWDLYTGESIDEASLAGVRERLLGS